MTVEGCVTQEDVMVFVNSIACIIHRAVQSNHGRPNKNIGESFLLVPPPRWCWHCMVHRQALTLISSGLETRRRPRASAVK